MYIVSKMASIHENSITFSGKSVKNLENSGENLCIYNNALVMKEVMKRKVLENILKKS